VTTVTARAGISSIISVVLLILIAVSVGIIIYAFATGWVGSRLSGSLGPETILTIEQGSCNATNNTCVVIVRNDGGTTAYIVRAYVIDPEGIVHLKEYANPIPVTPRNITKILINPSDLRLRIGYSYKIVIVAQDGTQTSTTIKAT